MVIKKIRMAFNLFRRKSGKKFNIIFILLDGVRADRLKKFPNFKGLCGKGTLFSNSITYAPYTIASLYSIFTGVYGFRNGVNNYYGSMLYNRAECKTITEYLKEKGYFTIGDTARELVVPDDGFIRLEMQPKNAKNAEVLEAHKKLLKECRGAKENNKNFFLFLYNNSLVYSLLDHLKTVDDFNEEYFKDKEGNRQRYDSHTKEMDDYIGGIMQEIKNNGLYDDSTIVFFSDHGTSMGERVGEKIYGSFCYDYSIKTFSVFVNSGLFPAKEIKNVVRTIDIVPTIMDIMGIKEDAKIKAQGNSLLPLVRGVEKEGRIAFSETGGLSGPTPSPKVPNVKCVRTKNFKFIINTTTGKKELYNVAEDPDEADNLAGKGMKEEAMLSEELKKFS